MNACLKLKRKDTEETPFMKNGRMLLEERIALFNGKCNPIRFFSAMELSTATNNYDASRLVSVKKFNIDHSPLTRYEDIFKDVVIGSNMSIHKNVLKLLGCCLETQWPTLVYGYVGHKNLFACIRDRVDCLSRYHKCRVRIAMGIANAVAYLHTTFSRPFVHRDIQSSVIILDENNVPKMVDFSLSLPIPEGQGLKTGFLAPDFCITGNFTEKDDVYCFGGILLVLLAGWMLNTNSTTYSEGHLLGWVNAGYEQRLIEIVDPELLKESVDQQQFLTFANLALSCISNKREDRPTITNVGKTTQPDL
ncbi:hypothetical protein I3843_07G018700 [Carya illinoinensis]|nr:hypothetical protein I3843_07G018700 [Carya illinoinensis]